MAGMAAPAMAEAFTALELDAAEQLIQLSESSTSSAALSSRGSRPVAASVYAPSGGSSSSSLRSVNAPPEPATKAAILGGCVDWEEEEEHDVAGSQRRVKRYRLRSEIYGATEEIGGRSGSSRQNKK